MRVGGDTTGFSTSNLYCMVDYPTSAEAVQFAGLDITVENRALFTFDNKNQNKEPNLIFPEI